MLRAFNGSSQELLVWVESQGLQKFGKDWRAHLQVVHWLAQRDLHHPEFLSRFTNQFHRVMDDLKTQDIQMAALSLARLNVSFDGLRVLKHLAPPKTPQAAWEFLEITQEVAMFPRKVLRCFRLLNSSSPQTLGLKAHQMRLAVQLFLKYAQQLDTFSVEKEFALQASSAYLGENPLTPAFFRDFLLFLHDPGDTLCQALATNFWQHWCQDDSQLSENILALWALNLGDMEFPPLVQLANQKRLSVDQLLVDIAEFHRPTKTGGLVRVSEYILVDAYHSWLDYQELHPEDPKCLEDFLTLNKWEALKLWARPQEYRLPVPTSSKV